MPAFPFSTPLTANQLGINPLIGWQYEYVPAAWSSGAVAKLLVRATTINTRITVFSGSTSVQERSPIQGGGTAGSTPTDFTTSPATWVAMPGDRLKLSIDEVGGAVATVDGIIVVEPL
jgi:hypothetical protein